MAAASVNKPAVVGKPAIMLSNMASRTQEIRAVGAWVEVEPVYNHCSSSAVVSAQREEARLRQHQFEKDQKLLQFQEDVKKRVQLLERFKHEQQLKQSYKAVEVERNVVRQSAFAAERSTPRKNRCTLRSDAHLQIKQSGLPNTQGCIITDNGGDDDKFQVFEEHSNQVRKHSRHARRNLTSHKVRTEEYTSDQLPGGAWKEGATLDHPGARQATESNVLELSEDGDEYEEEQDNKAGYDLPGRSVHFDLDGVNEDSRQDRITRQSANGIRGCQVQRALPVPNIYPGVQSKEERVQAQNQRAMYRRLFMDIEREQVKENVRRLEHRKKINQLKKAKEKERQLIEQQAQQLVDPSPEVTAEASEAYASEKLEETQLQRSLEERRRAAQKTRETERYLEALKVNLREKITKQGIDLPPLCCCGPTVWDTDPDTCANNCIFYRNPKMFAKALSSLLTSCDMV